jgi:hypothetical protein
MWSILSAVNTVNLVNTVNAVRNPPPTQHMFALGELSFNPQPTASKLTEPPLTLRLGPNRRQPPAAARRHRTGCVSTRRPTADAWGLDGIDPIDTRCQRGPCGQSCPQSTQSILSTPSMPSQSCRRKRQHLRRYSQGSGDLGSSETWA